MGVSNAITGQTSAARYTGSTGRRRFSSHLLIARLQSFSSTFYYRTIGGAMQIIYCKICASAKAAPQTACSRAMLNAALAGEVEGSTTAGSPVRGWAYLA